MTYKLGTPCIIRYNTLNAIKVLWYHPMCYLKLDNDAMTMKLPVRMCDFLCSHATRRQNTVGHDASHSSLRLSYSQRWNARVPKTNYELCSHLNFKTFDIDIRYTKQHYSFVAYNVLNHSPILVWNTAPC